MKFDDFLSHCMRLSSQTLLELRRIDSTQLQNPFQTQSQSLSVVKPGIGKATVCTIGVRTFQRDDIRTHRLILENVPSWAVGCSLVTAPMAVQGLPHRQVRPEPVAASSHSTTGLGRTRAVLVQPSVTYLSQYSHRRLQDYCLLMISA